MPVTQLCEEMDTEDTDLLLHTHRRDSFPKIELIRQRFWFPKSIPVISFRKEPLAAYFTDTKWVPNLLIFETESTCPVNSACHFHGKQLCSSNSKVSTFKVTLELWEQQVNIETPATYGASAEILKDPESGPSVSRLVYDHLSQLPEKFSHYFLTTKDPWSGRIRSLNHLWTSKVNPFCLC